jgi:hypothetical protein
MQTFFSKLPVIAATMGNENCFSTISFDQPTCKA